jgi:hypothetical protein
MASGRRTQPEQNGLRPGRPRSRRRGVVEAATREDHPPRPGHVRTTRRLERNRKRPHLSLSLNFVSRPKFRVPLEIPTRVRSSYFDPAHYYFLFSYGGRRGGDGEQQYNLFWHDVDIFPPKMTKK